MPLRKPRIHLFYGTDSRASSLAFRQWSDLFAKKYGSVTAYRIDADGVSADTLRQRLAESLQGQALFPEPKLIAIRRLTEAERGKSRPLTAAFLDVLAKEVSRLDEGVTLLVWEGKDLPADHPLLAAVKKWEKDGLAAARRFDVPGRSGVAAAAAKHLSGYAQELAPDAQAWLNDRYAQMEKNARLAGKLKAGEALLEDDRTWWLYQVLETASLLSGPVIALGALQEAAGVLAAAVGPFDIGQAVLSGAWKHARSLAWQFERSAPDDGAYFSLYAALRWQAKRESGRRAAFLLELLAQVEIIAKNYGLEHAWLFGMVIERLAAFDREGARKAIIEPRTLWKVSLTR